MSDNFPEVIKDTKYWYQQGQWVPSRIYLFKNKSTLESSEHQREKEEKRAINLDFFLYPAKQPFKIKDETKTFSDKQYWECLPLYEMILYAKESVMKEGLIFKKV